AILPRARKRSKPAEAGVPRHEEVKFEDIRLYLVERKMGSSRRGFLTQLARSKGFIVEDILSNDVTHVVSEDNQPSPLWTWLRGRGLKDLPRMHVVDISWFTESMRASRPVAVETRHRIQEILRYGRSFEVEKILADERYQTLKLFTSVFGVGPKTAEKWYRRGLRSFSHVLTDPSIHLNRMQRSGFLHYGDISRAVSKAEARALGNIIDEAAHAITPDAVLALTGGFRRYRTCLLLSVLIWKWK
uniref:Deoxynucleotidyltransferase, terminal n=1 Tax=Sphaeramia orbicularis TaxID=375764 RepID=A0A673CAV7_9TELE